MCWEVWSCPSLPSLLMFTTRLDMYYYHVYVAAAFVIRTFCSCFTRTQLYNYIIMQLFYCGNNFFLFIYYYWHLSHTNVAITSLCNMLLRYEVVYKVKIDWIYFFHFRFLIHSMLLRRRKIRQQIKYNTDIKFFYYLQIIFNSMFV